MASKRASHCSLALAYAFMMAINGISMAQGPGFSKTNAEISELNPTYLTPDGTTFLIWPIIYLLQGVGTFQEFASFDEAAHERRSCLAAAFTLNSLWLFMFTNELYVLSCIVIGAYTAALAKVYSTLKFVPMGPNFRQELSSLALRTGVSVNLIWLCVASCINLMLTVSRYMTGTNAGEALAEPAGSQAVACFACLALTILVWANTVACANYDGAFALAAAWALFGVVRGQGAHGVRLVTMIAGGCTALCILLAYIAFQKFYVLRRYWDYVDKNQERSLVQ